MNTGPYSLYTGTSPETAYRQLFTTMAPITQEVIWINEYNSEQNRYHDVTWRFSSATYGQKPSLTKQFVDMYLKLDGTPFTSVPGYQTIEFADEFQDRDYRMKQTMITPGYQKYISGTLQNATPNFTVTRTGYHPIKWCLDDETYESATNNWNSIPIIRYAEVLLNYAEAKAELAAMGYTTFTETDWNRSIALLRSRAGVNTTPPVSIDRYLYDYYLGTVSDMWILEIRRERSVEMVLEASLRWDDVMRWKVGELLENDWLGMYISDVDKKYDFDGNGTVDLEFNISDYDEKTSLKITTGTADQSFRLTDGNSGYLVYNYQRKWEEKKYLRPIPTTALLRNENLGQNVLWE